jgi:hypothetical protein
MLDFKPLTKVNVKFAGVAIAKLQSKFTLVFSSGEAICKVKIDTTAQTESFPRLVTPRIYHSLIENPDQKLFALGGVCL